MVADDAATDLEAFRTFLLDPNGGNLLACRLHPDLGGWTGVERLNFHWTLKIKPLHDRQNVFDRWCYKTLPQALAALEKWEPLCNPDPGHGWHRHPMTGRRRPNGDPAREYRDGDPWIPSRDD